jgi:phosphate transport system substrate-binding protein
MSTPAPTSPPSDAIVRQKSRTGVYVAVAIVIVLVLVIAGFSAGWFKGSSPGGGSPGVCQPPSGTYIEGAGSSLVFPLMYQWETVYGGGTAVNYASVGSSSGITDISAKTVAYGASDAPLDAAQRQTATGLLTIPESAGGVVPIYNLPGVGALDFNGTVLANIYLGTITQWNDPALVALNPKASLPDQPIQVVWRSDGSGTSFIWTSYLSLESPTWAQNVGKGTEVNWPVGTGQAKNAGVSAYVGETPYTIGYVDLNYALTDAIQYGSVENPSGTFVLANVTNTATALTDAHLTLPTAGGDWYNVSALNSPGSGDYPITSLTYVLVYQNLSGAYGSSMGMTDAQGLVDFLYWAVTTGQSYSTQLFYVPLPGYIVTADEASIGSITYNGASVPNSCGASV